MKKAKRIIALALAVFLVSSSIPVTSPFTSAVDTVEEAPKDGSDVDVQVLTEDEFNQLTEQSSDSSASEGDTEAVVSGDNLGEVYDEVLGEDGSTEEGVSKDSLKEVYDELLPEDGSTEDTEASSTEVSEEGTTDTEEGTSETKEDPTTETEATEAGSEKETESESEATDVTTEEVTKEATTEEPVKVPTFENPVPGVSVSGLNFASMELLIGTSHPEIFTWDTEVVSEYNGVYLTRYQSATETANAYTYYYGKADFISPNITFTAADPDDVTDDTTSGSDDADDKTQDQLETSTPEEPESADLSNLNQGDDAFSIVNDLNVVSTPYKTVALIDSGVDASDLVGNVSVIGDSVGDDNGHGTRMYNYIKDEAPSAKILSIKALDSTGHGKASDIYAAIEYAIDAKVDIINLSMSASSVESNNVVVQAINDAISHGIVVIGAAGNNGANAKYFIPGCVKDAIIVGAFDGGHRLSSSNYGDNVDYYVDALSTSEAAAKMTGYVVANNMINNPHLITVCDENHDFDDNFYLLDDFVDFTVANETETFDGYTFTYAGSISAVVRRQAASGFKTIFGTTASGSALIGSATINGSSVSLGNSYRFYTNSSSPNGYTHITSSLPTGASGYINSTLPSSSDRSETVAQTKSAISGAMFCSQPSVKVDPMYVYDHSASVTLNLLTDKKYRIYDKANHAMYVPYCVTGISGSTGEQKTGAYMYVKYTGTLEYKHYWAAVAKLKKGTKTYLDGATFAFGVGSKSSKGSVKSGNYGGYSSYDSNKTWTSAFSSKEDWYIDPGTGVALAYIGRYTSKPTVYAQETSAPSGYNIDDTGWYTVPDNQVYEYSGTNPSSVKKSTLSTIISNAKAHPWVNTETPVPYYVAIKKVDNNGYVLSGVPFKMTYKTAAGTSATANATTGTDGIASFTIPTTAGYTATTKPTASSISIVENWSSGSATIYNTSGTKIGTKAYSGYIHDTSTKQPTPQTTAAAAKKNAASYTYTNVEYIPYYVAIKKVDDNGYTLKGVPFTMTYKTAAGVSATADATTDASGIALFTIPDTAHFTKSKAPTTSDISVVENWKSGNADIYNGSKKVGTKSYSGYTHDTSTKHPVPRTTSALATSNAATYTYTNVTHEDYYIAVKKVDNEGYALSGVTFSVSYKDNTGTTKTGTITTSGKNGIGTFHFAGTYTATTKPTSISVKENWTSGSATLYKNGSDAGIKRSPSDYDVHDTSTKNPTPYTSETTASNNADSWKFTNYRYIPYYVAVKKVDDRGYTLANVPFTFNYKDVNGTAQSPITLKTGKDGIVVFTIPDSCHFTESTAPAASSLSVTESWKTGSADVYNASGVKVGTLNATDVEHDTSSKKPTPQKTSAAASKNASTYTFTNYRYIPYYVAVKKVDDRGYVIGDVPFTFEYHDANNTKQANKVQKTGKNGIVIFEIPSSCKFTSKNKPQTTSFLIRETWTSGYATIYNPSGSVVERVLPEDMAHDTSSKSPTARTTSNEASQFAATYTFTNYRYVPYYVAIIKKDDHGQVLQGVPFTFNYKNASGVSQTPKTGKTGKDGIVVFEIPKSCKFTETKAPTAASLSVKETWSSGNATIYTTTGTLVGTKPYTGYKHDTSEKHPAPKTTEAAARNAAKDYTYTNVEYIPYYVSVKKTDEKGNLLSGVTFTISYKDGNGATKTGTLTTKANGMATYTFPDTEHYTKDVKPTNIVITENWCQTPKTGVLYKPNGDKIRNVVGTEYAHDPNGYRKNVTTVYATQAAAEATPFKFVNPTYYKYYATVKKTDSDGNLLNGVKFTVSRTGGTPRVENLAVTSVYTGTYTDLTKANTVRKTAGKYPSASTFGGDGFAFVYLGEYQSAPTVTFTEATGWQNNQAEVVTWKGGATGTRTSVTLAEKNFINTGIKKTFTAVTEDQLASALANANSNPVDNQKLTPYYIVIKKQDTEGNLMTNVPFSITVNKGKEYYGNAEHDHATTPIGPMTLTTGVYADLSEGRSNITGCIGKDPETIGTTNRSGDGYIVIYLGQYTTAPTVVVEEKWTADNASAPVDCVDWTNGTRTVVRSGVSYDVYEPQKTTPVTLNAVAFNGDVTDTMGGIAEALKKADRDATYIWKNKRIGDYVGLHKVDEKGNPVKATFDIYGTNDNTQFDMEHKLFTKQTSSADGIAEIEVTSQYAPTGPYKYFYAVETKVAEGYELFNEPVWLNVYNTKGKTEQEIATQRVSVINPNKVYAYLWKVADQAANCPVDVATNPNYSLAGTVYEVFKGTTKVGEIKVTDKTGLAYTVTPVSGKSSTYTVDETTGACTGTSLDMSAFMDKNPDGTFKSTVFTMKEKTAGKGFKLNANVVTVTVTADNIITNPAQGKQGDVPWDDPVAVQVIKNVDNSIAGAQVIPGATFELRFYAVEVGNKKQTFESLSALTPSFTLTKTTDANGKIDFTRDNDNHSITFPYGYATVVETIAPAGFATTGTAIVGGNEVSSNLVFALTEDDNQASVRYYVEADGSIGIKMGSGDEATVTNIGLEEDSLRGDLTIKKVDQRNKNMGGIRFKITNNTTKEVHYVITDANGVASTENSYVAHSTDTNKYDTATAFDSKAGVWFSKVQSTNSVIEEPEPKDELGALPVGTYTVVEVEPEGTQAPNAMTVTITDGTVSKVFDSGNDRTGTDEIIVNQDSANLSTTAYFVVNGAEVKEAEPADNMTVVDKVHYENLRYKTTYTLVAELYEKGVDTPVKTVTKNFTTADTYENSMYECSGDDELTFTGLNFAAKAGKIYSVKQYLYAGNVTAAQISAGTYAKKYKDIYADTVSEDTTFPVVHNADLTDAQETVKVTGKLKVHKLLAIDGNPAGATYSVTGVTDKTFSKTLTIAANGYSETINVPFGTYVVKETSVPTTGNWEIDETEYTVTIDDSGEVVVASTLKGSDVTVESTDIPTTAVTLKKASTDASVAGNPNYSLVGAEYKLYTDKDKASADLADASQTYANAIDTFTVKEDGTANVVNTSKLMNGKSSITLYAVESKAGKGYKRNTSIAEVTVTYNTTLDNPAVFNVTDEPVLIPADVLIEKIDAITGSGNTASGQSLEGAEFTITVYKDSIDSIKTSGYTSQAGTEVLKITKNGDKYTASSNKSYQIGYMTVKETKLPTGYTSDDANWNFGTKTVPVTTTLAFVLYGTWANNNADFTPAVYYPNSAKTKEALATEGENLTASVTLKAENRTIRGNVNVTKKDLAGNAMANVKFKLENTDTHEVHYIYTDANGVATTVTKKYGAHVNYYDGKDDSDGTSDATVWFKTGANGDIAPVDGENALPVGHYVLTEEKCKANKGYQLNEAYRFEVKGIEAGGTADQLYTATTSADGNFYNSGDAKIGTTAMWLNGQNKSKYSPVVKGAVLEDVIAYENLKPNTKYTAVGTLMQVDETGKATAVKTVTQEFTTSAGQSKNMYDANGTVTVKFEGLDLSDKAGAKFVVFEKVYLGTKTGTDADKTYGNRNETEFPLVHEDLTDDNQTVYVEGLLRVHKILNTTGNPAGAKYEVTGVGTNYKNTLTIADNGYSETISMPYGEYTVKEVSGPTVGKWTMDETVYSVKIDSNSGVKTIDSNIQQTASDATVQSKEYLRTFAKLVKTATIAKTNPNYSLEGAEYKLFENKADAEAALASKNYDKAFMTFRTDANGDTDAQEVTKYMAGADEKIFYLVESKSAKNYLRSTEVVEAKVTKDNDENNPAVFEVKDVPVELDINLAIEKIDKVSGSGNTAKTKSLDGATFTVDYYAAKVDEQLTTGAPTSTETLTVTKKDGKYVVNYDKKHDLGWLVVKEITLPDEYTKDDVKITIDGKEVTEPIVIRLDVAYTNDNAAFTPNYAVVTGAKDILVKNLNVVWENTPIRGNLGLNKMAMTNGEDDRPFKGISFEIENKATGEKHIMVTDENGVATTKTEHYGEGSVWFGMGEDGEIAPKDGFAALPLGTYIVRELRTEANEGWQINPEYEAEITKDQLYVTLATGTNEAGEPYFYNVPNPVIKTKAVVESTGSKTIPQDGAGTKGEPQKIIDTVDYSYLREDTTYTLVGTLMVVDHGKTYTYQQDGKDYVITKEIKTEAGHVKNAYEKTGTVTMEYTVYPENYEGCSFTVFNKLYYGTNTEVAAQYEEIAGCDIFPVVHENIEDKDQTVEVADIRTSATDDVNEEKIVKPEGTVTITDKVNYTGLTVGETYTISGDLHVTGYTWKDADGNEIKSTATDEPLKDAEGKVITATDTFVAETSAGTRTLKFSVDASQLRGQSVVVFENLFYKEKRIAFHADLNDENQTIHFPEIHTTLYREGTGAWAEDLDENDVTKATTVDESSKEVMAAENAVVVDRIKYHNLIANRTYKVYGILMDKATGEALLDADGNKVTVEYEFKTPEVAAQESTKSPDARPYDVDGTSLIMSSDQADYLVDGYVDVTFPAFNATTLGNHTTVAYEDLYLVTDTKEIPVAEHRDIDDNDQTVRFIEISTKAEVVETKTQMVSTEEETTINDTVTYHNVKPGKEYTMTATVMVVHDKFGQYEDGANLLDTENKIVTASITFVPEDTDGEVVVPITFKGYLSPEMNMVCFEDMANDKGLLVATHNDITDEEQTTYKVRIGTTATVNDRHFVLGEKEATLVDVVEYHNLIPGFKYRVDGKLIRKSDASTIMADEENELTAYAEFTPEERDGFVNVTFEGINAEELRGDDIVVFETLRVVVDDEFSAVIALHEDIEDMGQTVSFPNMHTTLYRVDAEEWVDDREDDSTKEVMIAADAKVVDKVAYTHLRADSTYIVRGILMDKETGEAAKDAEGNEIKAETTFKTEASETGFVDGTVDVVFEFDATNAGNKTYVAFEELYYMETVEKTDETTGEVTTSEEELMVGEHRDIEDHDQTVRFIEIGTKAETESHTKVFSTAEEVTVYDTVSYHNVKPGKEYTMTATLIVSGDKTGTYEDGAELKDTTGKVVTATVKFTPTETDGEVMVPVKFKGVLIPETKIVAFETMKNDKGLVVATHNDIEDKDQTTYVPSIRTKASVGGLPVAFAGIDTILRDEVTYKNLVPGISYRVEGVLMQKSTGKQLVLGNEAVVASTTFKPETADGSVVVEFPKFDASTLANDGVVVFEKLYVIVTDEETHKDVEVEIANHEDLTDTDQTVVFPKVGTTAAQIQKGKNIEVTDVVKYEGLQVGYEYTVRGILVDTNGEPVIVGGKTIAAETTFTAKEADGTITVSLPEFDPFYMYGGDQSRARDYKYVVFEEVYVHATNEEGQDMIALVGEHKDLTDEGQTVFGHEEPKTGDDTPIWPLVVGFAVCIAGVGFLFIFRRRRKNQK